MSCLVGDVNWALVNSQPLQCSRLPTYSASLLSQTFQQAGSMERSDVLRPSVPSIAAAFRFMSTGSGRRAGDIDRLLHGAQRQWRRSTAHSEQCRVDSPCRKLITDCRFELAYLHNKFGGVLPAVCSWSVEVGCIYRWCVRRLLLFYTDR